MLKTIQQACSVLAFLAAVSAQADVPSYHVQVAQPLSPAQLALLASRFDAGRPMAGGQLELYLLADEYAELGRLGIRTRVLGRGRPFAVVAAERSASSLQPDTNYFTPTEIEAEIDRLVTAFPTLARKIDLTTLAGTAKTHDGRSIFACKISDQVALDEDEPAILLASQHHARELNTPVVVFGVIERILAGYATDPKLRALVDSHEIYCVPCVNPDGTHRVWTVDQYWRKNGRGSYGVDLNRNYPFLWGLCGSSTRTSSQTYRGPAPASEPETQTMMALSRWLRPELYLDFHSSGREVLFPYAPCATVHGVVDGLLQRYVDSLRGPMTYGTRKPSASGEAPEFHWADGGSLAMLTEISTSFQPAFASALAEAARVWPGVEKAVTTWRPAVRGHVRSVFKAEPVVATITYSPNLFSQGEKAASRSRDGRYALWLPLGSHRVTFSAPGFRSLTETVTVTAYDQVQPLEVVLIPDLAVATMGKQGSDRIGTTTKLTYTSPADGGESYWILLSLGTAPGIPLGAGRVLPLNYDIAFQASLPPGLLTKSFGTLSATGVATAGLQIPNLPGLVGLTVYAAGLTENSFYLSAVKNFSSAIPILLRR